MNNFINIKNLKKYFKSGDVVLKVLDNLNFSVNQGKISVITGESGVGKSTLLSLIGGLDNVTDGEIFINSIDLTKLNEKELAPFRANNIGFVFQYHFLLQEFTAYENILLPYMIKNNNVPNKTQKYVNELLDLVNLKDRKNHKPGQLSGGECQRISLLRALVNKPQIIIADEPTGNLDEKNSLMVFKLIQSLNRKFKFTFLIATHNMLIKKYSDEIYLLRNGILHKR